MIHPSAIVDKTARLGKNVIVGPGAIIEADCEIGDECEIRAHAVITGKSKIGNKNQIGYGAIIGSEPQDLSFKKTVSSRVVVGDGNMIREYVTVHRGTTENSETVIGNNNFLMTGCHIAHNCKVGNNVTLANNVLIAGHVEVQDRSFLGGGAVIHQHCRIGELVILRGLSRMNKDVPPYVMGVEYNIAAGLNRVGMKRAGISADARRNIQSAFDLLYKSGLNVSQALARIEKELSGPEITKIITFIRASKRGICVYEKSSEETED